MDREANFKRLSFAYKIWPVLRHKAAERIYGRAAQDRPTGKSIRITYCNASGKAFSTLVVGSVVPQVDMSEWDENPDRGVWVWGNGEPVKLVNDCGVKEYEFVDKLDEFDLLEEVYKTVGSDFSNITRLERIAFTTILGDNEMSPMEKANMLCEEMGIQKRGNRQNLYMLITKNNLVVS